MANAAARRQWVMLAAFVAMGLVGVGCRAAADIDAATPTTVPVSTTTTTNDGAPTPTTSSSDRDEANPWPSVRPSDLQIDWDTNVSYGAMWRVQSAEPNTDSLEASWNTNDGTYNFDTGLSSSKLTIVSEADFRCV